MKENQTAKIASITFRTTDELKQNITQKAKRNFMSLSNYLTQLIERYDGLLQNHQNERLNQEKIKQLSDENRRLKKQNAFYENSKLDYHYNVLKEKKVDNRWIKTKNDVYQVMLNNFDYQQNDQQITLHKPMPLHVTQASKGSTTTQLFLLFIALLAYLAYTYRHQLLKISRKIG